MNIDFCKYQGTGNDFVMINSFKNDSFTIDSKDIATICHRRFGVGADGLILLERSAQYDFKMKYYNADGYEGSMCGNGGRCAFQYAKELGLIDSGAVFEAIDGKHEAYFVDKNLINLKMQDINKVKKTPLGLFIDTGSPHVLIPTENIENKDAYNEGKKIRYDNYFAPHGTNVNFYEVKNDAIHLKTYERGVENVTWACGTGSIAVAVGAFVEGLINYSSSIRIVSKGGVLQVSFEHKNNTYNNVWLSGPAQKVFSGSIHLV